MVNIFICLALFLVWSAVPASAQVSARASSALPAFSELQAGWNELRPGGETKCAKGADYMFSVRPGAKDKLLVWFEGGGACWGEDCVRERFYRPYFENRSPARNQGIFDSTNAANPFSEYSAVIVRYCTGDIHLGDRDATYTVRDETGESRQFTIHHRGQVNAIAVLRWVHENFPAPQDIFVSGTSGGAHPTPFYASLLARHYPEARVVALADSARNSLPAPDNHNWGFPGVVRRHPGWEQFPENWRVSDLFLTAARVAPRIQLLQFNHAYDANARVRLRQLGGLDGGKADLLALLRAEQRELTRQAPSFRNFTVGGRGHGGLPQSNFYIYSAGGRTFRDWVADAAMGKPVPNVECVDCSRPEFPFSERDLQIVERALALVSTPGAWNSDDPPQQCGPKLVRYSLNCALRTAVNEIAPGANTAGAWEVVYSAIARMGTYFDDNRDELEERGIAPALALQLFNNRPGTTVKDVMSLLQEARDRIRAELRRRAAQPALPGSSREDAIRRVTAITDDFFAETFARYPAQYPAGGRHGELGDNSLAALAAWQQKEDRWLEVLKQIDPKGFAGTPAWAIYGMLRERLETSQQLRVCREELWSVNPFDHWHLGMVTLASQQPVGTQEFRDLALSRFGRLPRYIDTNISNLREGLRAGYSAPRVTVELTLAQINALLAMSPESSPFFNPARRDTTLEFVQQWRMLVASQIHPAVERYRNFLRDEYLPASRQTVGVSGNPNGRACYRAQVRERTSLASSPDDLFTRQMRQLEEETRALTKLLATGSNRRSDLRSMVEALFAEPGSTFATREEALAAAETHATRAEKLVGNAFSRIPMQKLDVQAIPSFRETTAAGGMYFPRPANAPAVMQFNLLKMMEPGAKLRLEGLVFHEGLPGHHLEATRRRELPTGQRAIQLLSRNQVAFIEGWATYAVQLAYEEGLFSSEPARHAWLHQKVNGQAWAVADMGMHLKGWSRQEAIAFLDKYSTSSSENAASVVDRAIGVPGFQLPYSVGSRHILDLRERAKQALGPKFDIREFHDRVLEYGAVTLPMLTEMIDRWIASR